MGGRGSKSAMGSSTSPSASSGNTQLGAARIGNMSREERRQFLNDAPVGTEITGLVNIRTGNEVKVEKTFEYSRVYGGVGAGSNVGREVWKVQGETDPYISNTLRTAADGTNRYYRIR